ncbi:MAG: glyoxylate/hydroxypyruvate reductase A [Thalassobaculales bacterium]
MAVLFKSTWDSAARWRAELSRFIPDIDIRVWPEYGEPDDITFAVVWGMPPGEFPKFRRLRGIASLGAGVDHLMRLPDLPAGVPVTRLVDPGMTAEMSEYVVLQVLRFHRRLPEYAGFQAMAKWQPLPRADTPSTRVSILGLGVLGQDAAAKLKLLGFKVAGWSRSAKEIAGVETFHGAGGLTAMLATTDILVNLLPLTADTQDIVNADLLAKLPQGAAFVNCARGRHVVDADLLAALDSGQIRGAALDVFRDEPLAADHPYWRHPKVLVTPHVAAATNPVTAAPQVAENILRAARGEPLLNVVDMATGY